MFKKSVYLSFWLYPTHIGSNCETSESVEKVRICIVDDTQSKTEIKTLKDDIVTEEGFMCELEEGIDNLDQFERNGKLNLQMEITYKKNANDIILLDSYDYEPPRKIVKLDDDNLFEAMVATDVTLQTSDGFKLKAHIAKLSESSSEFKKLLTSERVEKSNGVIKLADIDREVLTEMLRFIYCMKVKNIEEIGIKLIKSAVIYKIPQLREFCLESFKRDFTIENVLSIAVLANTNNMKDLFDCCCKKIQL